MTLALQATGIAKRFPGVLANDHVNFSLERGDIHALLDENGAGKATLMNMLHGFYQPDEGEIYIQDQPVKITSPHDAIKKGVGYPCPASLPAQFESFLPHCACGASDVQCAALAALLILSHLWPLVCSFFRWGSIS